VIEWPEGRRDKCVIVVTTMLDLLLNEELVDAIQSGLWAQPMTLPIEKDLAEQLVATVEMMATEPVV
jgi:hypothetical protein